MVYIEPKALYFLITMIQFKSFDITVLYYKFIFLWSAFVTSKQHKSGPSQPEDLLYNSSQYDPSAFCGLKVDSDRRQEKNKNKKIRKKFYARRNK